jgi:hypothetical protein
MPELKNLRHEMFAREYVATGVGAEAYRRAYPKAHPVSTARVCASQLLTNPNIVARTVELRHALAKRADITEDKILTDYQEALDIAKQQKRPNDVVNAATAQAKLVGLLKDRAKDQEFSNFDNARDAEEIVAKVREQAGADAAELLAKAFGI